MLAEVEDLPMCVAPFHGLSPELCTVEKPEHNRTNGHIHSFRSAPDCGGDVPNYLKSCHPGFLLSETNLEL